MPRQCGRKKKEERDEWEEILLGREEKQDEEKGVIEKTMVIKIPRAENS